MADVLSRRLDPGIDAVTMLELDRRRHAIIWRAAGNRLLPDTLDMLDTQSDRLCNMHLVNAHDMNHAVEEHASVRHALSSGDAGTAARLLEGHVNSFDAQVSDSVTARFCAPWASR